MKVEAGLLYRLGVDDIMPAKDYPWLVLREGATLLCTDGGTQEAVFLLLEATADGLRAAFMRSNLRTRAQLIQFKAAPAGKLLAWEPDVEHHLLLAGHTLKWSAYPALRPLFGVSVMPPSKAVKKPKPTREPTPVAVEG